MTCDICERQFRYTFYVNDEFWRKVVGEEKFKNNQGIVCAHCTLKLLAKFGYDKEWYIIWNEPNKKVNDSLEDAERHS